MFQMIICLGSLTVMAVAAVYVGSLLSRKSLFKSSFSDIPDFWTVLAIPMNASVFLVTLYVFFQFIPHNYFTILFSLLLNVIGIIELRNFIANYVKPNIFTGMFSIAIGVYNVWYGSWVTNNILGFAIACTALSGLHCETFSTAFFLLIGLFFYDIFWVYGSNAMITVATGIDGPVKLLFPHTIFGDHSAKSLLGLGDLVIPGVFITQTLLFSTYAKRGAFYFIVALIAYFFALINTMTCMVYFQHGQPALLFIVPWLLITFCVATVWKGDVQLACKFSIDELPEARKEKNVAESTPQDERLWKVILSECAAFFGIDLDGNAELIKDSAQTEMKKKS